MSLDSFPRYPLMFGPSPIHRLDRLREYLEGAAVWAKRDDVNSGARLWREQDSQTGVPGGRRPGQRM